MGLFGSTKKVPERAPLKTAQQLFDEAIAFAKANTPLAYGAREGALKDISTGNAYYEGFQPTSFEQALGNQYFENIMPDIERSIKQNLSLSGIANSPILAQLIAKQRGQTGFDIGQYLSNLGNERARYSLSSRLGIDPYSTYQNYLATDLGQSNAQNAISFQNALIDYQNRANDPKNNMWSTVGKVGGGILGGVFGGPAGGMIGSQLGGGIGGMFDPNYQDISGALGYGGSSKSTGSGFDLGSMVSLFGGSQTGKTQSANSPSTFQIGDILQKLLSGGGSSGFSFA